MKVRMPWCKRGDDCSVALEGDCQKGEHWGRNLCKGVNSEYEKDEKKESQEEEETEQEKETEEGEEEKESEEEKETVKQDVNELTEQ